VNEYIKYTKKGEKSIFKAGNESHNEGKGKKMKKMLK
jgi:hypothetical protein